MARESRISWPDDRFTARWLGHSTVLINYYGTWIITDPVFTNTIGINFLGLGKMGLVRQAPLPISVEDLPTIDVVLISHAHMDHLDIDSLKMLRNKRKTTVITPINTGSLIKPVGFRKVVELAWGSNYKINDLMVKSFSTKHFGARTPLDLDFNNDKQHGMCYNSYLVIKPSKAGLFFMGDTGFTRRFKSKFNGDIGLVLMPIGGYNPWGKNVHVDPVQAIQMGKDLGAKKFMPIHWGTFPIGIEGKTEPIHVLQEASTGKQLKIVGVDMKPVIINKSINKTKKPMLTLVIPHPSLQIELKGHSDKSKNGETHEFNIHVNNKIVGEVVFTIDSSYHGETPISFIDSIDVDDKYRNKGIAEAVYRYVEKNYFSGKFIEIGVNPPARGFWEKMGYKYEGVLEYMDDDPTEPDFLRMTKQVKRNETRQRTITIPHETLKIKLKGMENGPGEYNYEIHMNGDYAGHVYFNAEPAGIYEIEIEKKYRRQGIAESVYKWIETKYFKGHYITLEAYASARKFWEKMGYEFAYIKEYEGHEPSGKPFIIMMTKQV